MEEGTGELRERASQHTLSGPVKLNEIESGKPGLESLCHQPLPPYYILSVEVVQRKSRVHLDPLDMRHSNRGSDMGGFGPCHNGRSPRIEWPHRL